MKMNFKTSFSIASTLVAAALIAGCASAPRADSYVAPPLGANWTYAHQDSGSYGSGRSEVPGQFAQRIWDGRQVNAFEGPQVTLLTLPNGNWVGFLAKDGRMTVSWDPPAGWDWPLEVGKTWSRQNKMKFHAQNREVPIEARQTVEAHEEVTVPAGTFKTFRVRTSDTLGNENVVWFSPEIGMFVKQSLQRTDKHPQGAGRRDSELKSFSGQSK